MEYGAIDLHKVHSVIRIIDETGAVVLERKVTTSREQLTRLFGERPALRVLVESGTESEWVAQCVEACGHEVVVADPNYALMYGARARAVKTDRRDVAALAETIVEADRLGQDIGALDVLQRYERWRRFDTVQMGVTTDVLNRLFSNDFGPIRAVRDIGLGLVDRMPRMKEFFIRQASGLGGDVPRLLKGEAL